MLHDFFANMSWFTGLEPVVLQTIALSIPAYAYTAYRTLRAGGLWLGFGKEKPVSELCSRILGYLGEPGWELKGQMIDNGTLTIGSSCIFVGSTDVESRLRKRESRMIHAAAKAIGDPMLAEVEKNRQASILAALEPSKDGTLTASWGGRAHLERDAA